MLAEMKALAMEHRLVCTKDGQLMAVLSVFLRPWKVYLWLSQLVLLSA